MFRATPVVPARKTLARIKISDVPFAVPMHWHYAIASMRSLHRNKYTESHWAVTGAKVH